MSKNMSWRSYVNSAGDFELPKYLYAVLNELMKATLDLGVLLSSDQAKLRAYKEQTKSVFKSRWMDLAQALESFDIIVPCSCHAADYCKLCGGSRYMLNTALSPDAIREITTAIAPGHPGLEGKLNEGLQRALEEVGR